MTLIEGLQSFSQMQTCIMLNEAEDFRQSECHIIFEAI